jgi:hypothetical protein
MSYRSDPAAGAKAITPSNTVEVISGCQGIYIGGYGDLAVTTVSGDVVTFESCPSGSILPVEVRLVMATNTTATALVLLYS